MTIERTAKVRERFGNDDWNGTGYLVQGPRRGGLDRLVPKGANLQTNSKLLIGRLMLLVYQMLIKRLVLLVEKVCVAILFYDMKRVTMFTRSGIFCPGKENSPISGKYRT